VLAAITLAVLLGMAALTIDVGFAYYTQRSLQASADAAALAGAQEMPIGGDAEGVARAYSASPGGKNARENVPGVVTDVETKCTPSVGPCEPVNTIVVTQTASVSTRFAGVLGLDSFTVRTRAAACAPCGSRPVDVMLVLDRTLSMCQDHDGDTDAACTDLNNAKAGLRAFLMGLDSTVDRVGLAILPPATGTTDTAECAAASLTGNYNTPSPNYVISNLQNGFKTGGALNPLSDIVKRINCVREGGITSYATAIDRAQEELAARGRADADKVIVFFSDGAANYGPTSYTPASNPYRSKPCHQGITSAAAAKAAGTRFFSVGYDLDALDGGANKCQASPSGTSWPDESPAITAYSALEQIASDPNAFYNEPLGSDLSSVFARIAVRVAGSRLIDG
jgi:Putative Flp pilus-assembly TadE/G-like/von Willebrand factor type A domain